MIKIIFLADTHLGFDMPMRPKKEMRRRGPDFFVNFDRVFDYARNVKADLIIHGGDLFYRTKVPQPIVDMVYERIFRIAEHQIPIVIVPGNHESSRLPISLYMQHPNIYYFVKPQTFKFSFKGVCFDISGFPCVRKEVKNKFPEIAKQIGAQLSSKSIKLLCMHQSIEGAQVINYTFRHGPDVIPITDLPNDYNLILSGHIHRMQILKSDQNIPIIYPGSIERTAFAEKDEEKGFYEITFDSEGKQTNKFIPLPTRLMVDIVLNEKVYTINSLKTEIIEQINKVPSDSIVRFKMIHNENLRLLTTKFIDSVLPKTMNYQIAGLRDLFKKQ